MIEEKRYIDEKTGEICVTKTRHIAAAFDEENGYLFWARKGFSKSFLDVEYPDEMSMKERGQMATLAKKIWSKTNMLGYRGNGGIRPYTVEQIGEIVQLRPYQSGSFVRKMIKVGMLARVTIEVGGKTETHFYVNPIYFFSSNRIPLNLYLIFKNQLDEEIPEWVKREYMKQRAKK